MSTLIFRARDLSTEPCVVCGVPAGANCRNPVTVAAYTSFRHDVPVFAVEDEKQAVLLDQSDFAQRLGMTPPRSAKRARSSTNNATPLILLDESLPAQNGAVVYVEALVAAATTAALPPANFRMWRSAAMLFRAAGTWSVLGGAGGVAQLAVPPASAGASGWVMTPSLPGGDVLRLTVTGQAATAIAWVASVEMTPF